MVEEIASCRCVGCGAQFRTPARYLKRGRGKYCSVACQTDAARKARWDGRRGGLSWVMKAVDSSGGLDACWPWKGRTQKNRRGYGRVTVNGRMTQAHRVVYQAATGADPGAFFVCHTCDNPPCCNPKHLFLGTGTANAGDMAAKGRGTMHRAKLRPDQVRQILDRLRSGERGSLIARQFEVSETTISRIKLGRTWANPTALRARAALA